MKKFYLIFAFLTLFIFGIKAQDTTSTKSLDELFGLSLDDFLNVVITPSKLPQNLGDITQKVDVLNAREIESTVSGNRNICELISCLPGASVSVLSRNDANWGTYGGIGPKYSTYMLQGIPVDAFMDPMSLDINAIERIEVQRGPASVIYPNYLSQDFAGSQSPLGGTVNLILRGKVEKQKTIFKTSLGTYNTFNGQFYHQNIAGNIHYFTGISHELSDYTNYGSEGSWLNMKKNPLYHKTKIYGGATLFMDKSENQKLSIFYQHTRHTGDGGRVYKGYDNEYGTFNMGYDVSLSDKFFLQSHLGMRSYTRTWQESTYGVVDTLKSNNGVDQLIFPIDISLAWRADEKSCLSVGADYQGARYDTWTDPLTGYRIYGNNTSAYQGGVYLQEEYRLMKKLALRGGIRMTYIQNEVYLLNGANPDDKSSSWSRLLWSVGAKYSACSTTDFYINAGSSFSTPSFKSIGGTIALSDLGVPGKNGQLPNPGIKPENGIGLDAGMNIRPGAKFDISLRGFYTVLQDGIIENVVSQNPSQTQSINTESSSTGGEIEISHKISSSVSWYVNATYLESNVTNGKNANQNDVEIPFSPNFLANLGGSYLSTGGLAITLAMNYNGGFYDGISRSDRTWYTPGFIMNAYISKRVARNNSCNVDIYAKFYNITNHDYDLPWQFKNPGFSAMAGLRVILN